MQQRLQVLIQHMLVIELDDAAVHEEQVQTHFHGTSQEHGHIVGVQEIQMQGGNAEGIETAVDPLIAIHHTQLGCRQTGQRTGNDVLHLVRQRGLGELGVIYAGALIIGQRSVHTALELLGLEDLLAAAVHFSLEPIVHLQLIHMEGEGEVIKAVLHFQHRIGIFRQVGCIHGEGPFKGHDPFFTEASAVISAADGILAAHFIHNIEYFFSVCIHLSLRGYQ